MQTQEPGWSRDAPPSVVQATTRTQERALFTTATFLPKLQQLSTLLHNGMFYQTVGNAVGALVAYSNAATYCYLLRREVAVVVGGDPDAGEPRLGGAERLHRYLGLLEQKLLGYVEGLQQRVRAALASASASAPPADKDPKDEQPLSCADMAEVRPEAMRITFADVVGMEREKEALVDAFLHPLVYPNLYPKLARGVLLYGPPGTGKTYLARAAVSELQLRFPQDVGVLFFDPTGATLKGKFVGETEKRIVGAFTCAARRACEATDAYAASHGGRRKKFVSVLFIDEFDSIAGDRGTDTTGLVANSVNTLLQMMDGVQSFENVAVIGATNYPWGLDSAVLRRFAEHVFVRLPGVDDIAQLLQRELRSKLRGKPADLYCYCADTLTRRRVHAPSEHMRGASCGAPPAADSLQRAATEPPPATAQQGGGTAEDAGEKDPVPFVDTTSYLQGARMREVAQAMYDGHASNADVATVVNRAFTAANGAALRRGSFTRFSVTTRPDAPPLTFALSNFTKLRAPEGAPLALLPALRAMRQTRAATAVALRSLAEPPSASAPAPFAQMPASLHVAGRALPNRASLTLDSGEVFLHLQYLLLAPTELLFDEPGIGDLYVHSEDVRADGSTADTVRVIFTRALRVSNAAVEAAAAADEGGGEDDVAGLGALPSPKAVYDTLRPLLEPFTQSVRERRGAEAASTLTSAALALGLFERASVVAALARGDLAAATSAMPASDFSASLLQSGEARRDAAAVHGEWLRAAVALTAFAREFVGAAPLEAPVKARVQAVVGASGPVARPSKLAGLLDVLTQAALERSIRHAMGTASAAAAHPLQKLLARAEAPPMKALPTALPASLRTTPFAHNKTFYFRSSVNLRDPAWGTTKFSTSVTSALVSLPVKALAAAASTVSYLLMGGGGGGRPRPQDPAGVPEQPTRERAGLPAEPGDRSGPHRRQGRRGGAGDLAAPRGARHSADAEGRHPLVARARAGALQHRALPVQHHPDRCEGRAGLRGPHRGGSGPRLHPAARPLRGPRPLPLHLPGHGPPELPRHRARAPAGLPRGSRHNAGLRQPPGCPALLRVLLPLRGVRGRGPASVPRGSCARRGGDAAPGPRQPVQLPHGRGPAALRERSALLLLRPRPDRAAGGVRQGPLRLHGEEAAECTCAGGGLTRSSPRSIFANCFPTRLAPLSHASTCLRCLGHGKRAVAIVIGEPLLPLKRRRVCRRCGSRDYRLGLRLAHNRHRKSSHMRGQTHRHIHSYRSSRHRSRRHRQRLGYRYAL